MTPFWVMPIGIARGWGMKEINSAIFHYLYIERSIKPVITWTTSCGAAICTLREACGCTSEDAFSCSLTLNLHLDSLRKFPTCSSSECQLHLSKYLFREHGRPPILHNWRINLGQEILGVWRSADDWVTKWSTSRETTHTSGSVSSSMPYWQDSDQSLIWARPIYTPSEKIFLTLILP